MNKEEFVSLLEEELEVLEDAISNDESQRDYVVNGFYEYYVQPSCAACSNILFAVPEDVGDDSGEDDEEYEEHDRSRVLDEAGGINLMVTVLQEAKGFTQYLFILSLINRANGETIEREMVEGWKEVEDFAVEKWYNVYYDKTKKYDWYYKDGVYEEEVVND